jgi:phosphoglycolate phosphatase
MVGDTSVDMRAGKAAGAQTVGVLCGFGEQAELLRSGADMLLMSTAGLPDLLLNLPRAITGNPELKISPRGEDC